mmetsp:Transcript_3917/g.11383  ORF Transcript_3917/g.11383 Transcript_3917/m.11383 type:complete len:207 (+) Transcript_3917:459-1079(+)
MLDLCRSWWRLQVRCCGSGIRLAVGHWQVGGFLLDLHLLDLAARSIDLDSILRGLRHLSRLLCRRVELVLELLEGFRSVVLGEDVDHHLKPVCLELLAGLPDGIDNPVYVVTEYSTAQQRQNHFLRRRNITVPRGVEQSGAEKGFIRSFQHQSGELLPVLELCTRIVCNRTSRPEDLTDNLAVVFDKLLSKPGCCDLNIFMKTDAY